MVDGINELMILSFFCMPLAFVMTILGGMIVMRTKVDVPYYKGPEKEKKKPMINESDVNHEDMADAEKGYSRANNENDSLL